MTPLSHTSCQGSLASDPPENSRIMVQGGTFLNINLLLCQCRPSSKYSSFPIDQPSPPAFQNMYLQSKIAIFYLEQTSPTLTYLSPCVCTPPSLAPSPPEYPERKNIYQKKIRSAYPDLSRLVLAPAAGIISIVDTESGAQQVRVVGCGEK
mgnify:CR=1 FL=1